jgi:hypothetical protein
MIVLAKVAGATDVRPTSDELYMLLQSLSEVCDGERFLSTEFQTVFGWEKRVYVRLMDEVEAAYRSPK